MKNNLIIWALCLFGASSTVAQDVNFSQINQLPVMVNPANTGSFDKDWRVSGIFRNTTYTAAQAFTTGGFMIEKRLKKDGFLNEKDVLGMGIYVISDLSNNGALRSSYVGFSTAYGKAMNVDGTSRLSIGVQGVWATRRMDMNKLTFEDQFTSGGFENMNPSADAYKSGSSSYLDLNAGIAFNLTKESHGLNLGAAIYHATKPKEQFREESSELPIRYTFNAGGYFSIANADRIYLNAITNQQGKATDYLFGAYFSKNLDMNMKDLRLNIGSFYRVQSAIIPYIGLQVGNWTGALSYDVASSSIRKAEASRKSLELSMTALF